MNITAVNQNELAPRGHYVSISCNPCRPFNHLCNNCVVLWTVISSFVSSQNQGIIDVVIVIFSEAFSNDDQSSSNTIYLLLMNIFGVETDFVIIHKWKY